MRTRAFIALAAIAALTLGASSAALAQEDDDLFGDDMADEESSGDDMDFGDMDEEAPPDDDMGFGGDSMDEEPVDEGPLAEGDLKQPVPFAQRPLTIPHGTLRIDAAFDVLGVPGPLDTNIGMFAGAAFGLLDDIEVGAQVLPLIFRDSAGDFTYGDPRIYGMYRFLEGDIEAGARVELVMPANTDFGFSVGAPVLIRLGDSMRIDTGLEIAVTIWDNALNDDAAVGLSAPTSFFLSGFPPRHPLGAKSHAGIPFVFNFNVMDSLFVGGQTGLGVFDFSEFGDTLFIPFGFQGGYTIAGDQGPLADISARFQFPALFTPGADDAVNEDVWQLTFAGEIYLYLLD